MSSRFTAFSDDLNHFVRGDIEADAFSSRGESLRGSGLIDDENLAVLALYSDISFPCSLFQQSRKALSCF